MWRAVRFLLRLGICLTLLAVLALCAVELWVNSMTAGHCHTRTADCRQGDVGVVLGCSKYLRHGVASAFFAERMDAAAELWKAGKLRCIIVSGDNREKFYNEPRDMKEELVRRGVPADRIVCDYAGLRPMIPWCGRSAFSARKTSPSSASGNTWNAPSPSPANWVCRQRATPPPRPPLPAVCGCASTCASVPPALPWW